MDVNITDNQKTSIDEKSAGQQLEEYGIISIIILIFSILIAIKNIITFMISKRRSKRIGEVTTLPVIPFPIRGFKDYAPRELKKDSSSIRIQQKFKYTEFRRRDYGILKVVKLLDMISKDYPLANWPNRDFPSYPLRNLPSSSLIISMRMDGFIFGKEMHYFIPIGGGTSGSHFTYRMFGDNRIQVTYYVEEGVSYVAGFCIYVEDPTDWGVNWSEDVLKNILNSKRYPVKDQSVETINVAVEMKRLELDGVKSTETSTFEAKSVILLTINQF
uniref:Wsv526 n=1 Tax=Caenorhabditis tropicalis TaxID=1561998 RepID=A0A1I7UFA4_9PELO